MKILITVISAVLLSNFNTKAQYISNSNFADAIRNLCHSCIDADNNLLPPAQKLEKLDLYRKSISNLHGIEGFTHLTELDCQSNPLLASLPDLPVTLINLNIKNTGINSITSFPPKLRYFYGDNCPIESLPILPPSLETLNCQYCGLKSLPTLPESLLDLDIENSPVSVLPELPNGLQMLNIRQTKIKSIPQIPKTVYSLRVDDSTFNCIPSDNKDLMINSMDPGKGLIPFCKKPIIPDIKKCISGDCVNGFGTLQIENAENKHITYTGRFKDSLYNGQGVIIVKDKFKYTGSFNKGLIDGKGVMSFESGDVYTGEMQKGIRQGVGTYVFKNGKRSTGIWKDGRLWEGNGFLSYDYIGSYYGGVKENMPEGQGVFTHVNGKSFIGSFSKGSPFTGKGYFFSVSDSVGYEGNFVNGKYSGMGTYTNPKGEVFIGNFVNGNLNGNGKWSNTNGSKYEGNFKDGNLDGYGVMKYYDGMVYKGNWENSRRNGKGSLYDATGNLNFSGDWTNDKVEEKNIAKKADEEVYTTSLGFVEFYKPGEIDMDKGFSLCCRPVTQIRFPDYEGSFVVRVWKKSGFDNKSIILVLYDFNEDTKDVNQFKIIEVETQSQKEAICYEVHVKADSNGTILVRAFLGKKDKENFIGKGMIKTTIPFGK